MGLFLPKASRIGEACTTAIQTTNRNKSEEYMLMTTTSTLIQRTRITKGRLLTLLGLFGVGLEFQMILPDEDEMN